MKQFKITWVDGGRVREKIVSAFDFSEAWYTVANGSIPSCSTWNLVGIEALPEQVQ